jgi:16S rRNA (cytosine967-C5)-methyltransferase
LLRRKEDIAALAKTQLEILQACFGMLARGGRLLYATCSVLPDENTEVVQRFLQSAPEARLTPLTLDAFPGLGEASAGATKPLPGAPTVGSWLQLLPGSEADSDGFHYACLEKTTPGT